MPLRIIRNCWHLAAMRLREQPLRHFYLISSLAVATVTWWLSASLAEAFLAKTGAFSESAIMVSSERGGKMPLRYAARIEAISGVSSLLYSSTISVLCRAPASTATLNGMGGDAIRRHLRSLDLPQSMVEEWERTPNGVLVGAALAQTCGWRPGMAIQPPTMDGRPLEIRIVGIFNSEQGLSEQVALTHFDYVNRQIQDGGADQTWYFKVYADRSARAPELANRIQAEFEASDPPVLANTSIEADNALARFGDVRWLVFLVMASAAACVALVFASILAHLAMRRRASMRILLVIGFKWQQLAGGFVLELMLVVGSGVLLGLAAASAALAAINPRLPQILGTLAIPHWAYFWLPSGLLALALVSLFIPTLVMFRLRPIDAKSI